MEDDSEPLADLAGEVFDPAELLAYQEGAIVSRTLVDSETATLTVFAVAEDQRISEHSAPHEAMLQVLDGTARVTIEDEEYTVPAGEAIVMPADVPHAVGAETEFKMLLTMIR
jgi:quercetin dioxygenase-like cupin family protein